MVQLPTWAQPQNKVGMSYIFDALQRSQAERVEADKPDAISAIDLLENAEREAAVQWDSEQPAAEAAETAPELPSPLFGGEGFGPGAAWTDSAAIAKALQDEELRETFSHFQTLEAYPAAHSRLVFLSDANSPAAEAFHLLSIRLRNIQRARAMKTLLLTSTVPQEGKSVVAANLACALGSGARQKVLLLDGDMRRPSQPQLFGFAKVPGLSNYLRGERSIAACLYHLAETGIWILPAGDNPGGSSELIQSPQLPKLMTTLSSWFDYIVIDSPPVLPMVDTSVWARLADGILLVARNGTTKKRKLQKGLETLDPGKLIGAVLNASTSAIDSDYYYYADSSAAPGQPGNGRHS